MEHSSSDDACFHRERLLLLAFYSFQTIIFYPVIDVKTTTDVSQQTTVFCSLHAGLLFILSLGC